MPKWHCAKVHLVRFWVIGARNLAALCLNGRFSCCGAADGFLAGLAASARVRARSLTEWAQSRLAAVRRAELKHQSGSGHWLHEGFSLSSVG